MFCDVWTINLYFYLILKRKTKGIKQGEAGTGIIKKSVCEKKYLLLNISNNSLLDGTLVIVKDTKTQTVFALQGWKACGVCYTVVVLANDDGKQVKFVRYSDSNEKQSI